MRRIQVTIDDKHYAFLKRKSEQEKKSISLVLREILDNYIEKPEMYSLLSLAGIVEDPEACGRDHGKWIYS